MNTPSHADLEAQARGQYAVGQGRKGDWMQTVSGRMFWPLDPRACEVDIYDIAVALGNECRYAGQVEDHYSVAQHSVYVSYQVPDEHALVGLMHDAPEAYCKDIHRPIKRYLAGYSHIEDGIWRVIAERFGMPYEMPECVKVADDAVLLAEKAQIVGPSPAEWSVPGTPASIRIAQWTPRQARFAFLSRFKYLTERTQS